MTIVIRSLESQACSLVEESDYKKAMVSLKESPNLIGLDFGNYEMQRRLVCPKCFQSSDRREFGVPALEVNCPECGQFSSWETVHALMTNHESNKHAATLLQHKLHHYWKTQLGLNVPGGACLLGVTLVPMYMSRCTERNGEFHSNATHKALLVYKAIVGETRYFCSTVVVRCIGTKLMILTDFDDVIFDKADGYESLENAILMSARHWGTEYISLD